MSMSTPRRLEREVTSSITEAGYLEEGFHGFLSTPVNTEVDIRPQPTDPRYPNSRDTDSKLCTRKARWVSRTIRAPSSRLMDEAV